MTTKKEIFAITIAVALAVPILYSYATSYAAPFGRGMPWGPSNGWSMGNMMGSGMMNPEWRATGPQNQMQRGLNYGGMGQGMMGSGMMGSGMMEHMGGNNTDHCRVGNMMGNSTVSIMNNAFYPSTLTVKKGTAVTWFNMDGVVHTVKSGTPKAPTNLFGSNPLEHMDAFSYTFNEVGEYTYFCEPHPDMTGKVVVQ